MTTILAAMSAAVAVIGWGSAGFCLFRLGQLWNDDGRTSLLLLGVTSIVAGLALQASMATLAWEFGLWGPPPGVPSAALSYRAMLLVGLLVVAGSASFPKCRHKGWLTLAAAGGGAAGLSWVF